MKNSKKSYTKQMKQFVKTYLYEGAMSLLFLAFLFSFLCSFWASFLWPKQLINQ